MSLHPAAHALHYCSSCFEGFKAYRRADGGTHVFRLERHIERLRQSARLLVLPEPDASLVRGMVLALIDRSRAEVPESPGSLYLRPLLFGTTANIGAAATPADQATLVVMASPVWDYFAGGMKPLRILMEPAPRSAPHLGVVKTGGNYAAALGPTLAARREHKADQVLFCPNGEVQETGAANFLLMRERSDPHAQPRFHFPARRHARFAADAGPRDGLHRAGTHRHRGGDFGLGRQWRGGCCRVPPRCSPESAP